MKEKSVWFTQALLVCLLLIAAVAVKLCFSDFYEELRLKLSNLIGDKGGYDDIVILPTAEDEIFTEP